jgi:hypothetical protein
LNGLLERDVSPSCSLHLSGCYLTHCDRERSFSIPVKEVFVLLPRSPPSSLASVVSLSSSSLEPTNEEMAAPLATPPGSTPTSRANDHLSPRSRPHFASCLSGTSTCLLNVASFSLKVAAHLGSPMAVRPLLPPCYSTFQPDILTAFSHSQQDNVSSCRLASFASLSLTPSIGNRLVVNGQFPGPLIEANAGNTIIVNVKNSLDFPVRPLSFLHLHVLGLTRLTQFPQIALHWHVRLNSFALAVSYHVLAISPLVVPLPPF